MKFCWRSRIFADAQEYLLTEKSNVPAKSLASRRPVIGWRAYPNCRKTKAETCLGRTFQYKYNLLAPTIHICLYHIHSSISSICINYFTVYCTNALYVGEFEQRINPTAPDTSGWMTFSIHYSEYTVPRSRLWKNITINHTGISNLKWRLTRTVHGLQYSFKLTQELRHGANITLVGVFGVAV